MGKNTVPKMLGIHIIFFLFHFFSFMVLLGGTLLPLIFSTEPPESPGQCVGFLVPCGWSLGGNTAKFEFRLIAGKKLQTSNSALPTFCIRSN